MERLESMVATLQERGEEAIASEMEEIIAKGKVNYWIPPDLKAGALRKELKLKEGEPLTPERIEKEIRKLEKKYPNGGYNEHDLQLLHRLNFAKRAAGFKHKKAA